MAAYGCDKNILKAAVMGPKRHSAPRLPRFRMTLLSPATVSGPSNLPLLSLNSYGRGSRVLGCRRGCTSKLKAGAETPTSPGKSLLQHASASWTSRLPCALAWAMQIQGWAVACRL